ncbi:MAG: adenylate kinase [Patescibacteria group bacterium]|nr:adenylate kinase [Patescibacteria group bacterium]
MPIAIILLGPQGSGKGTVASEFIGRGYNPVIMGDLIRKNQTDPSVVNNGGLASDESVAELFESAVKILRAQGKDFVLDGCIRTNNQVHMVINKLPRYDLRFFLLDCSLATCLSRIAGRKDKHRATGLPEREDDKDIATIKRRISLFRSNISSIIFEIEKHKGLKVHTVSAENSVDEVVSCIDGLMSTMCSR